MLRFRRGGSELADGASFCARARRSRLDGRLSRPQPVEGDRAPEDLLAQLGLVQRQLRLEHLALLAGHLPLATQLAGQEPDFGRQLCGHWELPPAPELVAGNRLLLREEEDGEEIGAIRIVDHVRLPAPLRARAVLEVLRGRDLRGDRQQRFHVHALAVALRERLERLHRAGDAVQRADRGRVRAGQDVQRGAVRRDPEEALERRVFSHADEVIQQDVQPDKVALAPVAVLGRLVRIAQVLEAVQRFLLRNAEDVRQVLRHRRIGQGPLAQVDPQLAVFRLGQVGQADHEAGQLGVVEDAARAGVLAETLELVVRHDVDGVGQELAQERIVAGAPACAVNPHLAGALIAVRAEAQRGHQPVVEVQVGRVVEELHELLIALHEHLIRDLQPGDPLFNAQRRGQLGVPAGVELGHPQLAVLHIGVIADRILHDAERIRVLPSKRNNVAFRHDPGQEIDVRL